jgi:hypothetical protein
MRGAIPPLFQYVFMAWYLVKLRDNFFSGRITDVGEICWDDVSWIELEHEFFKLQVLM